jgi:hypothetical protein
MRMRDKREMILVTTVVAFVVIYAITALVVRGFV